MPLEKNDYMRRKNIQMKKNELPEILILINCNRFIMNKIKVLELSFTKKQDF